MNTDTGGTFANIVRLSAVLKRMDDYAADTPQETAYRDIREALRLLLNIARSLNSDVLDLEIKVYDEGDADAE